MTSALPWSIRSKPVPTGFRYEIIDARGGVVALMKAAGGRKAENARAIVDAVNGKADVVPVDLWGHARS